MKNIFLYYYNIKIFINKEVFENFFTNFHFYFIFVVKANIL